MISSLIQLKFIFFALQFIALSETLNLISFKIFFETRTLKLNVTEYTKHQFRKSINITFCVNSFSQHFPSLGYGKKYLSKSKCDNFVWGNIKLYFCLEIFYYDINREFLARKLDQFLIITIDIGFEIKRT